MTRWRPRCGWIYPGGEDFANKSSGYQTDSHKFPAEDAMTEALKFIDVGSGSDARAIAVRAVSGAEPGLLWLGGFKSDMQGTKAAALAGFALERGRALVRFDYSGHGESKGAFVEGTIGRWLDESLAVFLRCCRGP